MTIRFQLLLTSLFFCSICNSVFTQTPGGNGAANLNLWVKADLGTSCTINACLLDGWTDQSGSGNNATQTGTSRPTYQEVSTNYNPGVDIIGNVAPKQHFVLPSGTIPSGGSDYTVLYVANNVTNTGFIIAGGVNVNLSANRFRLDANGGTNNSWQSATNDLSTPANATIAGKRALVVTNYENAAPGRNTTQRSFLVGTHSSTLINTSNSNNKIGLREDGGGNLLGDINEIIVYSRSLTAIEQSKVESYLAVKYGITIDNTGGGAQGDYIDPAGATIWDADLSPAYHNDVIGIGRDDVESLNQKQSHAYDDSCRIYFGTLTTSNALNASTISSDNSYILLGHNTERLYNVSLPANEVPIGLPSCGLYSRLEREWKVTKTNITDDFNWDVKIHSYASNLGVIPADLRLLVDDDGDFSNGGTQCYYNGDGTGIVLSYSGTTITVSNISDTHVANNSTKYMTIGSVSAVTPLPVELSNFEVSCDNNFRVLSWTTESEINNAYFTIERSRDAVYFENIVEINASDNSSATKTYEWLDMTPFPGTTYYRLSQTDYDGMQENLQTKSVNCSKDDQVIIYPNPFKDYFTVYSQESSELIIVDLTGKLILKSELQAGENTILLDDLAAGTYMVSVILENGEAIVTKLCKN